MWPYSQVTTDLVTFTEEILNGKLHFLCSVLLEELITKHIRKNENRALYLPNFSSFSGSLVFRTEFVISLLHESESQHVTWNWHDNKTEALRLLIHKNKIFDDMKMTHFFLKFPFDPPRNIKKSLFFWCYQGRVKREHWKEMD